MHLFYEYRINCYLANTRATKVHLSKIIYKIASRKNIDGREIILQPKEQMYERPIIQIISVYIHEERVRKQCLYHSSRVIMISMDSEHRQANIEVWVFIINLTKSENTTKKFLVTKGEKHIYISIHLSRSLHK